jgi:hypothetical protein
MRAQKLGNVTLAKKLDCDEKAIRRLLDPHYNSGFPNLENALNILGQRLEIGVIGYT